MNRKDLTVERVDTEFMSSNSSRLSLVVVFVFPFSPTETLVELVLTRAPRVVEIHPKINRKVELLRLESNSIPLVVLLSQTLKAGSIIVVPEVPPSSSPIILENVVFECLSTFVAWKSTVRKGDQLRATTISDVSARFDHTAKDGPNIILAFR
jgi:hypothetical protein